MRFIHARIYTVEDGVIPDGYLETTGSILSAVGAMDEIVPSTEDVDLEGACILPGLVDAHTCLGLKEDAMRKEGNDWNEQGWTIGPELRAADGFNPADSAVRYALEGGVTAVAVSPGNINLIGGQIALVKLDPRFPGEMVLEPFCALKLAVGEQVKRPGVAPCTRMAVGAMLRDCFGRACAGLETGACGRALTAVLRREKPVFIHANRCDDIAFAVSLCKEFDLRCVIVHGADALLAGEVLRRAEVPVIVGSMLLTADSYETRNMDTDIPVGLDRLGVRFSISTDHHMSPVQSLHVAAALAVRDGLDEDRALESITIEPARFLGAGHRIGSLKQGKDADFAVWSGEPFHYKSRVQAVYVNGTLAAKF